MVDCSNLISLEDQANAKLDVQSMSEEMSSDNPTLTTRLGKTKLTLQGRNDAAEEQRGQFNATFQAQFVYKRIGDWSEIEGLSVPEADKLNSWWFVNPVNSDGGWYGPKQSQAFPIIAPANPAIDDGWALTDALTTSAGDDRYQKKVSTVAGVATGKFAVGDVIELSDRAYSKFEVVAGGAANNLDILDAGTDKTAVSVTPADLLSWGVKTGIFDNGTIVNSWFEYLRESGAHGYVSKKLVFEFSTQLRTQKDTSFKPVYADLGGCEFEYTGPSTQQAFVLEGGTQEQSIFNGLFRAKSNPYTGSNFLESSTGIEVKSCRHNLVLKAFLFRGEGVVFNSEARQMNGSEHFITSSGNGLGVRFKGVVDDISIINSKIKANTNGREGILVDADCPLRQVDGFWQAESNWQEDYDNPARYGVNILSLIASQMTIYSEQAGASSEIYLDDAGTSRNTIFSGRLNKDILGGSNQLVNGAIVSQATIARQDVPTIFRGLRARTIQPSEYIKTPFQGIDGFFGAVVGNQQAMSLESPDETKRLGTGDVYSFSGEARGLREYHKNETWAATETKDFILGTFESRTVLYGDLEVIGVGNSGVSQFFYKVPFRADDVSGVVIGDRELPLDPNNAPPTVALVKDGANLKLSIAVDTSWHGANYRISYRLRINQRYFT